MKLKTAYKQCMDNKICLNRHLKGMQTCRIRRIDRIDKQVKTLLKKLNFFQ